MLIARLKTLTTIKTQSIIYGLAFLASTTPTSLLKPLEWAFRHHDLLLPIHRAFLLQLMVETFDPDNLPDSLMGVLVTNYPTGYFLEDRIVYDLLDGRLERPEAPGVIVLRSNQLDNRFLKMYNPKYSILNRLTGASMQGVTESFRNKREQIQEEYVSHYSDSAHQLVTSLVPNADAIYSIANTHFYDHLWNVADWEPMPYFPPLHFLLEETAMMVGSYAPRPRDLLGNDDVQEGYHVTQIMPLSPLGEWKTLASFEEYAVGEDFKPKEFYSITTCHWAGEEKPEDDEFLYSMTPVTHQGFAMTNPHQIDQPVSYLKITDFFENITMLFASPYVLHALSLQVASLPHGGLHATNPEGEVILKCVVWKEQFKGRISDGTEFPLVSGFCAQIRSDYYQKLIALYDSPMWQVISKEKRPF